MHVPSKLTYKITDFDPSSDPIMFVSFSSFRCLVFYFLYAVLYFRGISILSSHVF